MGNSQMNIPDEIPGLVHETEGVDAHHALDLIHDCLDGKEWDSDTLDRVADIIRNAGYVIREPE